jgi:hypothetical protein
MTEERARLLRQSTIESEVYTLTRVAEKLAQYSDDERALVARENINIAIAALNSDSENVRHSVLSEPEPGVTVADVMLSETLSHVGSEEDFEEDCEEDSEEEFERAPF